MKFSTLTVAICVGLVAPASGLAQGYMNTIAGGSVAKPPANGNYMPQGFASAPPAANGAALDGVAAAPEAPVANGQPAPTAGAYLEQFGGASSSMGASSGPTTSYAPTKSNVSQKSGGSGFGSYLDGVTAPANGAVAPAASTPEPAAVANSAPTAGAYLEQFGGGASSMGASSGPATSYAPTKSNVSQKSGGSGFGSYLDGVTGPVNGEAAPVAAAEPVAAAMAPTAGAYLEQFGGASSMGASSGPTTSYAPTKSNVNQKSGGSGFGSFLDGVGAASAAPATPAAPAESAAVPDGFAATSGSYLDQMGGGAAPAFTSAPKTSFAPTKASWKS